jgi:nitronate monooxygenase
VVDIAHQHESLVYHDVVNSLHANKAHEAGADGFICVNANAGGHTGGLSPEKLYDEIAPLNKPMICAGGVGDKAEFERVQNLGYIGAQAGTRFIASKECLAHQKYKEEIIKAKAKNIVLTDKISGVPVAVINNPHLEKVGVKANSLAKWLLKNNKTKRWMRMFYTIQSIWKLKNTNAKGGNYKDFYLAGKSVETIDEVKSVAQIYQEFAGK